MEPLLRELFAEHTSGCNCTGAPRVKPGAPPRTAYSVAEVATSLRVSAWTVRDLMDRGELAELRLAGRRVIPKTAFDELANGRANSANS